MQVEESKSRLDPSWTRNQNGVWTQVGAKLDVQNAYASDVKFGILSGLQSTPLPEGGGGFTKMEDLLAEGGFLDTIDFLDTTKKNKCKQYEDCTTSGCIAMTASTAYTLAVDSVITDCALNRRN